MPFVTSTRGPFIGFSLCSRPLKTFVVLVFAGSAEEFLLAKALAARPVALVSRHRNTRDWHENCLEIAE